MSGAALNPDFWQSPVFQLGLGMLSGNEGVTGDAAFRNALRGGMMTVNRSQVAHADAMRNRELTRWAAARRADMERRQEQARRLRQAAPQLGAGILSQDPEMQRQAAMGILSLSPEMLPNLLMAQMRPGAGQTTLMQNMAAAGLTPGTPEWNKAMQMAIMRPATSISVDTGAKLPSGHMWRDPDNPAAGVKPIPGGPVEKERRQVEYRLGSTQSALDRYKSTLRQIGPTWITGANKAKLQTAYTDLMIELKELFNLGVLQGPDMAIMERALRDPTTLTAQVLNQMGGIEAFLGQIELVQQKLSDARARAAYLSGGDPTPPALSPSTDTGWSIREVP